MREDPMQDVAVSSVSSVQVGLGSLDYGIRAEGVTRLLFHHAHVKKGERCRPAKCYLARGGVAALLGAVPQVPPADVEESRVVPDNRADEKGPAAPALIGDGPWWTASKEDTA